MMLHKLALAAAFAGVSAASASAGEPRALTPMQLDFVTAGAPLPLVGMTFPGPLGVADPRFELPGVASPFVGLSGRFGLFGLGDEGATAESFTNDGSAAVAVASDTASDGGATFASASSRSEPAPAE